MTGHTDFSKLADQMTPERRLRAAIDTTAPLQTADEHTAALAEIRRLWDSPIDTPDGVRLDRLIDLVVAYEEKRPW